jgi:hypothetical protein
LDGERENDAFFSAHLPCSEGTLVGSLTKKEEKKFFQKRGTFSKGPPSKGTTTQMEALVLKREIW